MATGWKKDYSRYKDFFLNVLGAYNNKPNLKIYLELILSLSTIIIFSIFAIRPTILTILGLNNEIAGKELTSSKLNQKVNNLQTANSILQSEASNLAFVSEAVPQNANADVLIKQIDSIATQNTVQILSFSASDIVLLGDNKIDKKEDGITPLAENAKGLSFTISVSGSYQQLFSFLISLENMRRPIKVDSFTINSNTTEEGPVIIMVVSGRVPFI